MAIALTILLVYLTGLGSGYILRQFLSAKKKMADKVANKAEAKIRIQENPWRDRKVNEVDLTKRNTLMPSNSEVIPKGYEKKDGELVASMSLPVRDYEFRFYGSQLLIGDRAIISGLPVRPHTIEILKDNSVYIDGVEAKLIGADVDSIKQTVLMNEGQS